jgi:DNA-binding GntR family transcriptional regulator
MQQQETQAADATPGAALPEWGPVRSSTSRSLSRHVQLELERLITEGELQPGERLNEVALAKRLGVSRGPVREAARALEKSGLVTVIVNRGAFVRMLTLDEAMDIYELNAVIFGLAAGQLAVSITAVQALELQALVDGMDRAGAASDPDAFFELNVRFHQCIMSFARNRQAEAVYSDFSKKLLLFRRRSFDREGNIQQSNSEHRGLLQALAAGQSGLARERAESHARAGRARFLGAIEHDEAVPRSGADRAGQRGPRARSRRRAHA